MGKFHKKKWKNFTTKKNSPRLGHFRNRIVNSASKSVSFKFYITTPTISKLKAQFSVL